MARKIVNYFLRGNTPLKMRAASSIFTHMHLIFTFAHKSLGEAPRDAQGGRRTTAPPVYAPVKLLKIQWVVNQKKKNILIEKTTLNLKVQFPIIKKTQHWTDGIKGKSTFIVLKNRCKYSENHNTLE